MNTRKLVERVAPGPGPVVSVTTRRTTSTVTVNKPKPGPSASPIGSPESMDIDKMELYRTVCSYEASLAENLDPQNEYEEVLRTLREFIDTATEIYKLKMADQKEKIEDLKDEGTITLLCLRKMNRFSKLHLKSVKDVGAALRKDVDVQHLHLQNLLYEVTHVYQQVDAIQEYRGADEKIELIPLEQFYVEAPASIAKTDKSFENAHVLKVGRLEYEYLQRHKLTEQISNLIKEKECVNKEIDEKQSKLETVRPLFKNVLEATKPLQDFFGMNMSTKVFQYRLAEALPVPLYILFSQALAYHESKGEPTNFGVTVSGDEEAARKLTEMPIVDMDDDSDSEFEFETEVETPKRHVLRKHASVVESVDDPQKKLIEKHPLHVELIVKTADGDAITLTFSYLRKLNIITVQGKVKMGSAAGNMPDLNGECVLGNLFTADKGESSPNPANAFLLSEKGVEMLREMYADIGRPYIWAQKLGGLDFATFHQMIEKVDDKCSNMSANVQVCVQSIQSTIQKIRKRLTNQVKLWKQLRLLESKVVVVPEDAMDLFPPKISCHWTEWQQLEWSVVKHYDCVATHITSKAVTADDLFYQATLERGEMKLFALIVIKMDFPKIAPIFFLQLSDGRKCVADSAIRDMEKEVNIFGPKDFSKWKEHVLSLQMKRLMVCMDVLLETDALFMETEGPSSFSGDKLYTIHSVGRNERRPFHYTTGGYFEPRF